MIVLGKILFQDCRVENGYNGSKLKVFKFYEKLTFITFPIFYLKLQ